MPIVFVERMALSTAPRAHFRHMRVLCSKFMSTLTMSFPPIEMVAALKIFFICNYFKMVWIYAKRITAQMVYN